MSETSDLFESSEKLIEYLQSKLGGHGLPNGESILLTSSPDKNSLVGILFIILVKVDILGREVFRGIGLSDDASANILTKNVSLQPFDGNKLFTRINESHPPQFIYSPCLMKEFKTSTKKPSPRKPPPPPLLTEVVRAETLLLPPMSPPRPPPVLPIPCDVLEEDEMIFLQPFFPLLDFESLNLLDLPPLEVEMDLRI